MNVTSKTETKKEVNNDKNVFLKEQDSMVLTENMNVPFSDFLNSQIEKSYDINDLSIDYNYDSIYMTLSDAMFFVNLAQEGQFSVNTTSDGKIESVVQTQIAQTSASQKTVEVTNQLTELIQKAQSTQKPVRISFDNDVSVVLKIDKHGKVTAEFIPGSVEVENYLRNNISSLRQKFDEQNLPYNDLFYRQNDKHNDRQNRRQNKEKGEK